MWSKAWYVACVVSTHVWKSCLYLPPLFRIFYFQKFRNLSNISNIRTGLLWKNAHVKRDYVI